MSAPNTSGGVTTILLQILALLTQLLGSLPNGDPMAEPGEPLKIRGMDPDEEPKRQKRKGKRKAAPPSEPIPDPTGGAPWICGHESRRKGCGAEFLRKPKGGKRCGACSPKSGNGAPAPKPGAAPVGKAPKPDPTTPDPLAALAAALGPEGLAALLAARATTPEPDEEEDPVSGYICSECGRGFVPRVPWQKTCPKGIRPACSRQRETRMEAKRKAKRAKKARKAAKRVAKAQATTTGRQPSPPAQG